MVFEFFPLTDIVDFKFHETAPWGEKFVWLGYESSNFMELLGTISMVVIYIVIKGVLIAIYLCVKCKTKSGKLEKFLNSQEFNQGLIRFFLETMFELIMCTLISFKMLEIKSIWNFSDTFAFVLSVIILFLSTSFLAFSGYYLFKMQPKLSKFKRK